MPNFKMWRGDTKTMQFTVGSLPSGGLTGMSFWFTAKLQLDDADTTAVIHKTTTDFEVVTPGDDSSDGILTVDITPTDTETLPDWDVDLDWDFQIEDDQGHVSTPANGTLTVRPDVTRAR